MFTKKCLSAIAVAASFMLFTSPFSSAANSDFKEVTSKLDAEGDFYLFINASKTEASMQQLIKSLKGTFTSSTFPGQDESGKEQVAAGFDFVSSLTANSGLAELRGIGVSSVFNDNEKMYRNRIVLYHKKDSSQGLLWNVFGKKAENLKALRVLPADTAFATFCEIDASLAWNWLKAEITKSNLAEMKESFNKFETEVDEQHGIDLPKALASVSGCSGIILALDATKKTMLPVGAVPMEIPEPSLAIVSYVKDDYIFEILKKNLPCAPKESAGGDIQKFQILFPMPLPVRFQPMLAKKGELLILASTEELIDSIISAQEKGNGLTATEEFKKLSSKIPDSGNAFKYISPKLSRVIADLQTKLTEQSGMQSPFMNIVQSEAFFYSVFQNTDEGFIVTANSSMNIGTAAATNFVAAPAAITAGMLLPALNNARGRARSISCVNNLKQIGLALKNYAIDYDDKFPEADGAEGLEVLRMNEYLSDPQTYVCPSSSLKAAMPEAELTESTVSYVYLGGFTEADSTDIPLAFDKPGNHPDKVCVLFTDGHVETLPIKAKTIEDIINALNERYKYAPEVLEKLKKTQQHDASVKTPVDVKK